MTVLTIVSQATTISLEQLEKGLEKAIASVLEAKKAHFRAECHSGVWMMPDAAVFWAERSQFEATFEA